MSQFRGARPAPMELPPLSEKDFMRQITDLADIRGWSWLHIRPGMTRDSWRTPVSGPLGKGWPDLFLCRPDRNQIIFAEVKREGGSLTSDQERVLGILRQMVTAAWVQDRYDPKKWRYVVADTSGMVEVYVWQPSDWEEIERVLR